MFESAKYDSASALVTRKHIALLLRPLSKSLIPISIGLLILFNVSFDAVVWLGLVLVFIGVSYLIFEWVVWYYDIVVVTREKLIAVKQSSLFRREIKEVPINSINEVIIRTTGFLSSVFGYGTVLIKSGSDELELRDLKSPFVIKNVLEKLKSKPSLAAHELIDLIMKAKKQV